MQFELSYQGYTAVIESHGGELISFKDREGKEYIWSGDPAFWFGRNPLLFPIVGNLKEGTVKFGETAYQMSRHGFARDQEFKAVEQSADRIIMELQESEVTLARYPYPFKLQVIQQLLDGGFSTTFRVENTGNQKMPFCIGAHTAFRCPMKEGETFEEYDIVFDEKETVDLRRLTAEGLVSHELTEPFLKEEDRYSLNYDIFARIDTIVLEGLKSQGISLEHRDNGKGLRMEFEGFPMLAFWTKGVEQAPFICLEPWHGCAAVDNETGNFEDKPHCMVLQPGEVKTLTYTVTVK